MPTGAELATAWVRVVPSMEGAQGELTKGLDPAAAAAGDQAGKKAGSKFNAGLKAAVTIGAAAITAGVVKVFETGMAELKFGEQINAQTQQLIDNTGIDTSVERINKYTLALSKVSGISEEELQAAGNSILKFGNVSADQLQRATAAINDMGAAGKDVAGTGEALGKALADPAKAAGLLKRQGVVLNEEQRKLIDSFIEAGDTASAQNVILESLEGTYGGMAEAAGGTLEGSLNKLNNSWENVAGSMVELVLPAVQAVSEGLTQFFGFLEENPAVAQALAIALGILTVAVIAITVATWAMNTALLANPITWIILAIVALIAALVLLFLNWDSVVKWISEVWAGFISWVGQVIDGFIGWWNGVWEGFASWITQLWEGFVSWITDIWDGFISWIMSMILSYIAWWNSVWTAVGKFFSDVWRNLTNGVQIIWQMFQNWIRGAVNGLVSWWNSIWKTVGDVIETVFGGIGDFIGGIWDGIIGGIRNAINTIIGIINGAIDGINAVVGAAGAAFGLDIRIPRIPGLALGGTVTRAGYAVVGEEGPELLKLPRGAQVNPNYDDVPAGGSWVFNNYAPLGSTPSQELRKFTNRRHGGL